MGEEVDAERRGHEHADAEERVAAVRDFTGGGFSDDVTLLVLKHTGR